MGWFIGPKCNGGRQSANLLGGEEDGTAGWGKKSGACRCARRSRRSRFSVRHTSSSSQVKRLTALRNASGWQPVALVNDLPLTSAALTRKPSAIAVTFCFPGDNVSPVDRSRRVRLSPPSPPPANQTRGSRSRQHSAPAGTDSASVA
jgi:hypothetical protein